jgi:hypothetical protein
MARRGPPDHQKALPAAPGSCPQMTTLIHAACTCPLHNRALEQLGHLRPQSLGSSTADQTRPVNSRVSTPKSCSLPPSGWFPLGELTWEPWPHPQEQKEFLSLEDKQAGRTASPCFLPLEQVWEPRSRAPKAEMAIRTMSWVLGLWSPEAGVLGPLRDRGGLSIWTKAMSRGNRTEARLEGRDPPYSPRP